jgi:hypothetical protein
MKVWRGESAEAITLVVAFAGTRHGNKGDLARDLQSQLPSAHVNPLDPTLPRLGLVGGG